MFGIYPRDEVSSLLFYPRVEVSSLLFYPRVEVYHILGFTHGMRFITSWDLPTG